MNIRFLLNSIEHYVNKFSINKYFVIYCMNIVNYHRFILEEKDAIFTASICL